MGFLELIERLEIAYYRDEVDVPEGKKFYTFGEFIDSLTMSQLIEHLKVHA